MSRNHLCSLLGALALCASSTATHAQAQPTYRMQLIGTARLNEPGFFLSVDGLNDKGEVVGSRPGEGGVFQAAYVWRDGVFEDLNDRFPSTFAFGIAINDSSDVLGLYEDAQTRENRAFLLRDDTVVRIEGEGVRVSPRALNNRRQVLAQLFHEDPSQPSLYHVWHRGQFGPPLEPLPGTINTSASRINDRVVVVGTGQFQDTSVPVVWENGTIMPIATPPGARFAFGIDVDNRGGVLGDALFADRSQSFVWRDGAVTLLPLLDHTTSSDSTDMNHRGAATGRAYTVQSGPTFAVLWRKGGVFDLNTLIAADDPLEPFVLLDWGLLINDVGQIVARGRDSRDNDPALVGYYLLTLVE